MKKILATVLVVVMAAGLIACSGKKPAETTNNTPVETTTKGAPGVVPSASGDVSGDVSGDASGNAGFYDRTAIGEGVAIGGWMKADWKESKLSEEDQQTFDEATAEFVGGELTPVAKIATQVVSGTNMAILCSEKLMTAKAEKKWVVAFIYKPISGKAELLEVADFEYTKYATSDHSAIPEIVDGGWTPCEITENTIQPEFKTALKRAAEGYTGVNLTGIACLGTQVVAGTNYVYICGAQTVTKEPVNNIVIAVVFENLKGQARIESIGYVDIAKLRTK